MFLLNVLNVAQILTTAYKEMSISLLQTSCIVTYLVFSHCGGVIGLCKFEPTQQIACSCTICSFLKRGSTHFQKRRTMSDCYLLKKEVRVQKLPCYSSKSPIHENGFQISHISFQDDSSLKRLGAICSLLLASYLLWVFYVSCRQKISDISKSRKKQTKITLNQFHDVIDPGRMAYQDLIRISFQPYYAKFESKEKMGF